MKKVTTTWVCDRCGTKQELGPGEVAAIRSVSVQVSGKSVDGVDGMDLCTICEDNLRGVLRGFRAGSELPRSMPDVPVSKKRRR